MQVNQRWHAKQNKIAVLINQVKSLQRQFTSCNSRLVPRNDIKFAFKLARDAIVSQTKKTSESSHCKSLNETCVICFEDTDASQIFSVDGCLHRYCFSCMKQHVEVKLLHGILPRCPHEGCKSDLNVDSCGKFLTPKIMETMRQRIKEASTPVTEKVYCAYPRCSVLMSKTELLEYSKTHLFGVERSGARRCVNCNNIFCINCKVPWHSNMTCVDYKRSNPYPPAEETKLKFLATTNLWRQCNKCNHMIELAEGCYHMTCRYYYYFFFPLSEWINLINLSYNMIVFYLS